MDNMNPDARGADMHMLHAYGSHAQRAAAMSMPLMHLAPPNVYSAAALDEPPASPAAQSPPPAAETPKSAAAWIEVPQNPSELKGFVESLDWNTLQREVKRRSLGGLGLGRGKPEIQEQLLEALHSDLAAGKAIPPIESKMHLTSRSGGSATKRKKKRRSTGKTPDAPPFYMQVPTDASKLPAFLDSLDWNTLQREMKRRNLTVGTKGSTKMAVKELLRAALEADLAEQSHVPPIAIVPKQAYRGYIEDGTGDESKSPKRKRRSQKQQAAAAAAAAQAQAEAEATANAVAVGVPVPAPVGAPPGDVELPMAGLNAMPVPGVGVAVMAQMAAREPMAPPLGAQLGVRGVPMMDAAASNSVVAAAEAAAAGETTMAAGGNMPPVEAKHLQMIGQRVARRFDSGIFKGQIISVRNEWVNTDTALGGLPALTKAHVPLFLVRYDDEDEEELDLEELQRARQKYEALYGSSGVRGSAV